MVLSIPSGAIWIVYVFFGLWAVLYGAYAVGYFRAQRPKKGTLEWISLVDKPQVRFACHDGSLSRRDILPILLCALFALGCWGGVFLLTLPAEILSMLRGFSLVAKTVLSYAVAPLAASLGAYLLAKKLCKNEWLAALAAGLVALDLRADIILPAFWLPAALFAVRYCEKSQKRGTVSCGLELAAMAAICAVGCYVRAELLFCAGALYALVLVAGVARVVRQKDLEAWLRLLAGAVFVPFVMALVWTLCQIPAAIMSGVILPKGFVNGDFWLWLWLRVELTGPKLLTSALSAMQDAVSIAAVIVGAFSAVCCLHAGFKRGDLCALAAVWLFVAFAVLWAFGFGSVTASVALVFCYSAATYHRRGGRLGIALSTAGLLALYLGVFAALWI